MKKKLLALAIAGVFAAPVAMADTANVNIYAVANVSFDITNNGTSTAGVAGTSTNKVSSGQSRIGFKGSEDLGGGTSAIWQVEQGINIDTCTWGTAARNTFAGLSSASWGTVLMGRHDTPYKIATRGLDVFADTIADNRSLMGMSGGGIPVAPGCLAIGAVTGIPNCFNHDQRVDNALAYISPAMSGFTIAVGYVPGAELATNSTQVKGSAVSMAALYNAGPINASLSYQTVSVGSPGTGTMGGTAFAANDSAKAWKLGGGYTMDAFQVNLVYEKTNSNIALTGIDVAAQTNWYLAGKFNVSASDAVKLAYTKAGTNPQAAGAAIVPNSGAKQISLGYDHNMSKRTTLYALYTKLSNDSAAFYGLATAVTTGGVNAVGAGASPSAWSLGMKHTF